MGWLRPVREKAFDYHIVTLAFLNAFALTGRTPTYMLTHGDAMGFMLLGFQPVMFFKSFRPLSFMVFCSWTAASPHQKKLVTYCIHTLREFGIRKVLKKLVISLITCTFMVESQ